MSKTNKKAIWGGIFLGSAVGTIIGMLITPRSGGETRQVLKKSARALPELGSDLSKGVQLQAAHLSESTLRNWEGTLTRLKEAIAAGIEASKKSAREINQSYEKMTDDSDSTNNN